MSSLKNPVRRTFSMKTIIHNGKNNSISRTRMRRDEEIKIHDYDSMSYDNDFGVSDGEVENVYNMIRAPRMPESLARSIENMEII